MTAHPNSLRYVLISPGDSRPTVRPLLDEAYRLWKKVWSQTFQELNGTTQLASDDFSRQSFIGAIFTEGKCLALGFFHRLDFASPASADDSYFRVWPPEALEKLIFHGRQVLVGSNITVDPECRGDKLGLPLRAIISSLMVKTHLASDADVMTGTMRRDRKMHLAAYALGAEEIETKVIHHHVEVDLVAFYRKKILHSGLRFDASVEALWTERRNLLPKNFLKLNPGVKPVIDFKKLANEEMEKHRPIIDRFPWEDPRAYGMWLAQTFHIVNHSTRLVALTGARVGLDRNDLHARFIDHAKEERGHQLIAVSDLKAVGYRVEDFPRLAPSAGMYQIQYYWIEHRGPLSFFGYILSLECLATAFGDAVYQRVRKAHGEAAAKFLKVHAADDVEHTEKAFAALSQLPEPEKELVRENLALSAELYRAMLLGIEGWLGVNAIKRAA